MKPLYLAVTVILATSAATPALGTETDSRTGLIIAPGWQQVAAHCGGCHSHSLVTAQRGDADFWLQTIRWMQKTQNLWLLPPEVETQIITYLARHYSESGWARRPPLAASLLPPER